MNAWSLAQPESPACCQICSPASSGQPMSISSNSKKEEVDALLSEGMSRLTFEELQQEQEDLHGVSATISEEKMEVNVLLDTLDEHLNGLKMGTAFAFAESSNRDFVKDYDFRMMFLRANRYDPKAAAKQMISFLEIKLKLFGLEKLTKEITLKDLGGEAKQDLLCGSMQILPSTDSSGRTVAFEMPGLRTGKSLLGELRARYYCNMNIIRSMEIPSKGMVLVSYSIGAFRDVLNGRGFVEHTKLSLSMPFHIAGLHLCIDNARDALFAKAAISVTPDKMRSKIKIHHGSHQECQYLLSTYGVSPNMLPLTVDNILMLDNHLTWYENCLRREESTVDATVDPNKAEPNANDVIFIGRRTKGNGNERMRDSAIRYSSAYSEGSPRERREIVDSMIADTKRRGGKFLKQDSKSGLWCEVPISEVREKITQMFRNLRRAKAGSQQRAPVSLAPIAERVIVEEPSERDILFGRQPNHSGNQQLRKLIEGMSLEYDAANRGAKKKLANAVVQEMKAGGARFLRQIENGKWEEVSDVTAGAKTATHFRNYRRCQK